MQVLKPLREKMWPSALNGSLTAIDALRLGAYLSLAYPLDRAGDVRSYESVVATLLNVKHVFALGSGRYGVYLLLKAWGLQPDDEIILSGYTCVVMPNAVRFAGCRPVYADIRKSDFNVDPRAIEGAITTRTRAVLMQHTYGIPADVRAIRRICSTYNLFLIEDGAHALGAAYDGKPVGHWGDAAVFSTETSKMISTDRGGLLVTNNPVLAERIQGLYDALPCRSSEVEKAACMRIIYYVLTNEPVILRTVSRILGNFIQRLGRRICTPLGLGFPSYDADEGRSELAGTEYPLYPRRLSGIMSKVGEWQISRLPNDIKTRSKKAAFLTECLPRYGATVPSYDTTMCRPSFLNFPFLVEDRPRWMIALEKLRLRATGYLRDPLHPPETKCHELNGYRWGSCPNAEYVSQHIMNFPVNRTVSFSMLRRLERLEL